MIGIGEREAGLGYGGDELAREDHSNTCSSDGSRSDRGAHLHNERQPTYRAHVAGEDIDTEETRGERLRKFGENIEGTV